MNRFHPMRLARLACCSLLLSATAAVAVPPDLDPAAVVREFREERATRTKGTPPGGIAAIDADISARAAARLAGITPAELPAAAGRDWAALYSLANRPEVARDLLRRYLGTPLTPEARHQGEMDLMLAAVRLNDGETIYERLSAMPVDPARAASLGSYFGGTFHHYIFNARGAAACLAIIDRIELQVPSGPFASDEERKSHGWARRQLAATKAFYLAETGRREEAVAVLDHALATLDGDIFRRDGLNGDRQRYLLLDRPAPTIAVDRVHGQFTGLEAYRGKVLMLEFTAHWCHACHAALPAIRQLHAEMKSRGFEVVALTTYYGFFGSENQRTKDMPRDVEFARMPAMLAQQQVTWPMVYTDRATMTDYGVTGIPQIMLLDKQGRIRKIDLGFSEAKMARFKAEIEALLAE